MALKIGSTKFVIRSLCAMAEPISWNGMTTFFKLEFIFSVVATTFHLPVKVVSLHGAPLPQL